MKKFLVLGVTAALLMGCQPADRVTVNTIDSNDQSKTAALDMNSQRYETRVSHIATNRGLECVVYDYNKGGITCNWQKYNAEQGNR